MTPRHNHPTRDVKPEGVCPSCDAYWANERLRKAGVRLPLRPCPPRELGQR